MKPYINIIIGIGVLLILIAILTAAAYIQNKKKLNHDNSQSVLPGIIKEISAKVLADNSIASYSIDNTTYNETPLKTHVLISYDQVTQLIQNEIFNNEYYKKLSRAQKTQLKSIIFGQVYLDWKYPDRNKIDMQEIACNNQKNDKIVDIITAAFISQGIDDVKHENYDDRIKELKIQNDLTNVKHNVIGKMDQYRKIKAHFPAAQPKKLSGITTHDQKLTKAM